jgi:hypothetical protein
MVSMSEWGHVAQVAVGGVAAGVGVYLRLRNPRYAKLYLLGWVVLLLILLGAWYFVLHAMKTAVSN